MHIGYIGLGKMGLAQVERLLEKKWRVVAWNRSKPPREVARLLGAAASETLGDVCKKLKKPRLVWLMVPHAVVDAVLKELVPHLSRGDTVIDGGNSFYKNSQRRARELARRGIHLLDVGVSGGPAGARHGACLMVGGDKKAFKKHEQLFRDLSASYSPFLKGSTAVFGGEGFNNPRLGDSAPPLLRGINPSSSPTWPPPSRLAEAASAKRVGKEEYRHGSYAYVGGSGAGHFVKMVHNGIEYGMMQSIAEGFNLLRSADRRRFRSHTDGRRYRTQISADKSGFGLNLTQIAELYNQGSVIESRLVGWLAKAYDEHGEGLRGISGEVAQSSGEGLWTVETAKELGVPVKVIEDSLKFRIKSKGNPSYTGQVVSALRNQFGGHEVKKR